MSVVPSWLPVQRWGIRLTVVAACLPRGREFHTEIGMLVRSVSTLLLPVIDREGWAGAQRVKQGELKVVVDSWLLLLGTGGQCVKVTTPWLPRGWDSTRSAEVSTSSLCVCLLPPFLRMLQTWLAAVSGLYLWPQIRNFMTSVNKFLPSAVPNYRLDFDLCGQCAFIWEKIKWSVPVLSFFSSFFAVFFLGGGGGGRGVHFHLGWQIQSEDTATLTQARDGLFPLSNFL